MTGAELVDALGKRVEDENDVNFPVAHKLQALNTAQKTLVNLLHNYYLTPLKSRVDSKPLSVNATSGYAVQDFTTLFGAGNFPIRDGITRLYDNTNKRFAKLIPEMDFMPSTTYSYGTVFCIEGNQIAVSPATCASVDVYYLKKPTDLADGSTECEFNESIEPILLDLAESEIFFADNRQNRGNLAYQRAFQQIQILNQRLAEIE